MGSQKSSESASYSGSGQRWALPYAKEGVNNVLGVYNQNKGNLQALTGNAMNLSGALQNKFSMGNAGADQARQFYQDTLANGPQSNPFLQGIIDNTNRDVINGVNSQFELGGRYGSDAHRGALTRELASADNQLRYQDYGAQQQRMDAAAGALTGANQGEAAQALGSYGVAAELPYTGTNALAQQLGALFSGGNSKSVSYAPNPLWGALGAGLGAAGAYFGGGGTLSERKAKTDIEKVGEFKDGLGIYTFRYKNDPDRQVFKGVMADEVEALRPWALGERLPNGYRTVNYAAL